MAYVVTEACIKCKYTDCVEVCPVDCFYEGPNCLVIDPDECIDCTLCVAECPVNAIYAEDDLPEDQRQFSALNAELCKVFKCIVEKKDPPADADDWKEVKNKLHLLEKEFPPGEDERNYPGGSRDEKDEDGLTGLDKLLMR